MLQGEHSAILSIFIKLPIVINIFVLSISEWLFYTGVTVINVTYCGRVTVHFKMMRVNVMLVEKLCQSNKLLQCHALLPPFVVCSLICLSTLVALIANNMDPDQTTPKGAVFRPF